MRAVSRNWTSAPFPGHFNYLKTEFLLNNNNNYVRISQGTHYVSTTKSKRLMLSTIRNTQVHFQIIHRNSVRTSQETHYVSVTQPNRLMLFGETVAVYCESHTEHTNTHPNNT
jgi:hypothetical protein